MSDFGWNDRTVAKLVAKFWNKYSDVKGVSISKGHVLRRLGLKQLLIFGLEMPCSAISCYDESRHSQAV